MKSLYLSIAFVVAVVAAGIAVMSASFPDASAQHAAGTWPSGTQATSSTSGTSGDNGAASVASLVGGLEDRLQAEPDDGKGWLLLAKSYRYLGRMDDAREAYRKADALGEGDPVVAEQLFGLGSESTTQRMDGN